MVAYSFKKEFVDQIRSGFKSRTIRAPRRRHARLGEQLQLYSGMRTKSCCLIRDDVRCSRLDEVWLDLSQLEGSGNPRTARDLAAQVDGVDIPLFINGIPLPLEDREEFAMHDGFMGWSLSCDRTITLRPWLAMVQFWMRHYGPRPFQGVIISWERAT